MDFLEEAQVIRCEFCGTSLLVAGRAGVLRYVVPPATEDPREAQSQAVAYLSNQRQCSARPGETFLFYAPFWRLKGTAYRWVFGFKTLKASPWDAPASRRNLHEEGEGSDFSSRQGGAPIKQREKVLLTRVLDHTLSASAALDLGLPTLGIRVQTFRLVPFGREHVEQRHSFLPLEIPLEKVKDEADRVANVFFEAGDVNPDVIFHQLVGKAFAVIYFPIWYVACHHARGAEVVLIDAVGKSVLKTLADGSAIPARLRSEETRKPFEFSEIRFLPFRCPNCAWEFPFYPFSQLHFCSNCRRLWRERNGEWVERSYLVVLPPGAQDRNELLWVPFFRCRASMEAETGTDMTMADFYRFVPLLKVIDEKEEARKPVYFYIPALKFRNPVAPQKLASRLTFMQPAVLPGNFPDGAHPQPAGGGLPEADALELASVILGGLVPANFQRGLAVFKGSRIALKDPEILYFPFTQDNFFWKEITTGLSFQQNACPEDMPNK
ncbi:MAG: hypothetical protein NTY64_08700 [Deltaproteobacteria bacterium]|nr:hypothetical protein [Deltaproteobacteria bacterium]